MKARIPAQNPAANLGDYAAAVKGFSWKALEEAFTWPSTGRMNIVHEAVDRWVEDPERADQDALVFEKVGQVERFTFRQLKERSSRLAHLLKEGGLAPGDRLFIFLPPSPDIYIALLACARLGVLSSPLYSTFNYGELEVRLRNGRPKAVLTSPDLIERLPVEAMSGVDCVYLTHGPAPGIFEREVVVRERLAGMEAEFTPLWVSGRSPLYLLYTSGSTGPPKGVVHSHQDMLGHLVTGRYVLDLGPGDVLWTDCDAAWVTGTVYGAFTPWLCGVTSVVQGDPFSASTWYRTIERHGVSVCYTTPLHVHGLAEAGDDLPGRYNLGALRHLATVGESLGPEMFYWCKRVLELVPHENWWMTETGMICLANFPSMDTKPGSMGRPVPGLEAAILDETGEPQPILTMGELAIKTPWPSVMTGIWRDEDRYHDYFRVEGWFLCGDMAMRDEDGYFYHLGRNDDLIKVGQQMIGPFEVEHVLCRHPAVAEAAVISKTTNANEVQIKAFLTLSPGQTPSARLGQEIQEFVRANLSSDIPLADVIFLDQLPKTKSGKLLRRVLRARELGLPVGDPLQMRD